MWELIVSTNSQIINFAGEILFWIGLIDYDIENNFRQYRVAHDTALYWIGALLVYFLVWMSGWLLIFFAVCITLTTIFLLSGYILSGSATLHYKKYRQLDPEIRQEIRKALWERAGRLAVILTILTFTYQSAKFLFG